jgi:Ser/Thr protein kinase RdoA (MazF antagonist)
VENNSNLSLIVAQFFANCSIQSIQPLGQGHINDTYLLSLVGDTRSFVLQRKNHYVFTNIEGMMNNIQLVTQHIRQKLISEGQKDIDRKVMTYLTTLANQNYYQDVDGNYWTMCLFIDGQTIESVTSIHQANNAGLAFGQFQKYLNDLPGNKLIETIPNFHNGYARVSQFKQAIESDVKNRVKEVENEVAYLQSFTEEMLLIQHYLDTSVLPLRITHNDTKINNVLFDHEGNILCVIDLDTVMPGSILFDFGDTIRTLCNTGAEDDQDINNITFNKAYFDAYTQGYLTNAISFLTHEEIKLLPLSCLYMTWEQSIRFLTDYINGDTYYKIKYLDHNKIRTLAQNKYLQELVLNKDFMEETIYLYTQK